MPDYEITKATARKTLSEAISGLEDGTVYVLSIKKKGRGRKRSIGSNAQIHVWFNQIAEQTGESVDIVKARCKRDYGLPILLEDEDFMPISWMLDKVGFWQMTDSQQCKLMRGVSITSIMSTEQCNRFRDSMRAAFMDDGIDLRYVNEPPMQ